MYNILYHWLRIITRISGYFIESLTGYDSKPVIYIYYDVLCDNMYNKLYPRSKVSTHTLHHDNIHQCLRLKTCILAVRTKIFFIVDSGADGF